MQPYTPQTLPLVDLDYRLLLPLVGQANAALARYDGLLQGIPNPAVMLSPLTTQEAVLSSKIEGTQATVDEVLQQEAGLIQEGEKYKDIQEISNYRQALYSSREYLKDYPLTDGNARHHHNELAPAIPCVQFKHGFDIAIGFARSRLHFHVKVVLANFGALQSRRQRQVLPELHGMDVLQYLAWG